MSIFHKFDAEKAAVKALGELIGFGRIIQLAHECWDAMLEAKHGIKGHSEGWTLAAADIIRERRPDADASSPSNVGPGRPSDSAPDQPTPKEPEQ